MTDKKSLYDCIPSLSKELQLITKKMQDCYLIPTNTYILEERANHILSAFLVSPKLSRKLEIVETELGNLVSLKQVYDLANQNVKDILEQQAHDTTLSPIRLADIPKIGL